MNGWLIMILRLALDLPEDKAYIRTTRRLSRVLLEDLKTVHMDIDDVETIVDELCGNVIRHAHSLSRRFQLILEYYTNRISINVIDQGGGFVEEDIPPIGAERADMDGGLRLGGFGVPLVKSLSDKLEFTVTDPQGTTAHAEKRIHYETSQNQRDAEQMDKGGNGDVAIKVTAGEEHR